MEPFSGTLKILTAGHLVRARQSDQKRTKCRQPTQHPSFFRNLPPLFILERAWLQGI